MAAGSAFAPALLEGEEVHGSLVRREVPGQGRVMLASAAIPAGTVLVRCRGVHHPPVVHSGDLPVV